VRTRTFELGHDKQLSGCVCHALFCILAALKAERMRYEKMLVVLCCEISLISEIWPPIYQISQKEITIMNNDNHEKSTYFLCVYNHASGRFESVEVNEKVYRTYLRTQWNIDDNDASFFNHEIQFSSLIGGSENAFENFREFIDTENTPEKVVERSEMIAVLRRAICSLSAEDQELVSARFFNGMTLRRYAQLKGLSHTAIRLRERRILEKLKKFLKFKK
jgi:RNA polymerase sigma factor (sigma-70 family)